MTARSTLLFSLSFEDLLVLDHRVALALAVLWLIVLWGNALSLPGGWGHSGRLKNGYSLGNKNFSSRANYTLSLPDPAALELAITGRNAALGERHS